MEENNTKGGKPEVTDTWNDELRTDTRYWHDYCMKADELYFIKGRLKFGDAKNAAPFPSAVIVFGNKSRPPSINTMSNK